MTHSNSTNRRNFLAGALAGVAGLAAQAQGRKLRYAVVGVGNRGRNAHLPLLREHVPQVEIAAICDITPENLQQALAATPGAKGYDDYHKMIAAEPNLDAVVVVIPNFRHAEVAIAALDAGKHVFCEKPMATHLADADRMIQAARKNQRILQVGQQMRYSLVYQRMGELIRDKTIGDLEYIQARLFRGDWNPRSWKYTDPATGKAANWRFLTKCAGSSLMEDGIHELDVIHWLAAADPLRIQAQGGNNVFKDRETIDNAGLLIEFANQVRCTFAYTVFTAVPNGRSFRFFGSKAEMTVEGTAHEPVIVIQPYRGKAERIPVSRLRPEEASFKEAAGGPDADIETVRAHQAFVKSIVDKAPVFADSQVGRDAVHISAAAEHALRVGQIVPWSQEV